MILPKNNHSKIDFFPIRHSLKNYSWKKARADLRSGLNVFLLDFPQGMAYALLAGFPVIFGLFASAIASIVGPIFASSRYVIMGPTNATAVLLLSTFLSLNLTDEQTYIALPILVAMMGVFMIIGSFLKLAGLIKYISRTVIVGYITAAALLIVVNQIDTVLGYGRDLKGSTFFEVLIQNFSQITSLKWECVLVAATTAILYFVFKRYLKAIPAVAACLLFATGLTFILGYWDITVPMLRAAPISTWEFSIPSLDLGFISKLGGSALALAFLAILESSSIAKSLAARTGTPVDLNQQMFSMGAANVASALGSGVAVSGSLTRSMLNFTSGARTPLSSIFSGILLVASIFALGPYIGYVPRPALSTLVILVGISLINIDNIKFILRSTKSDATVFFLTFFSGLIFPLNIAIYMGAAASIVLFLKKVSEPHLVEYAFNHTGELTEKTSESHEIPEISIIHVEGELFFGSSEIFLDQIRYICESPNLKVIILRMRNAYHLDATSAMAIEELIQFAKDREINFIVSGANEQVEHVLGASGVMDRLGKRNFFRYVPQNPNLSTRYALKRAQQLIGDEAVNITLFTAPEKSEEKPTSANNAEKEPAHTGADKDNLA